MRQWGIRKNSCQFLAVGDQIPVLRKDLFEFRYTWVVGSDERLNVSGCLGLYFKALFRDKNSTSACIFLKGSYG